MSDAEKSATPTITSDVLAMFEEDRPQFTPDDVCLLTKWSKPTFWRHLPYIPHSRVGRFVRFSERQIRQILAGFERKAA